MCIKLLFLGRSFVLRILHIVLYLTFILCLKSAVAAGCHGWDLLLFPLGLSLSVCCSFTQLSSHFAPFTAFFACPLPPHHFSTSLSFCFSVCWTDSSSLQPYLYHLKWSLFLFQTKDEAPGYESLCEQMCLSCIRIKEQHWLDCTYWTRSSSFMDVPFVPYKNHNTSDTLHQFYHNTSMMLSVFRSFVKCSFQRFCPMSSFTFHPASPPSQQNNECQTTEKRIAKFTISDQIHPPTQHFKNWDSQHTGTRKLPYSTSILQVN